MKYLLKHFFVLSAIVTLSPAWANPILDNLLVKIKKEQVSETSIATERESKFTKEKNKQLALLKEVKIELAALEAQTQKLTKSFEINEKELTTLENDLNIASGTLGEMFGVVKQTSGDLKSVFQTSIVSAQITGREKFVDELASRKALPTLAELKQLWYAILNEINESGKVTVFKTKVLETSGIAVEKEVTRIGSFNLVSDGKYLIYSGETKQVVELDRQPESELSMIDDLEESQNTRTALAIDPSRGSLLAMLVNTPSLSERIAQGGVVGYVILTLLFLGLILVGERLIILSKEKNKMDAQLESPTQFDNSVLGELMSEFNKFKDKDIETLELKMDASITKAVPMFERGISTIKLLAAVAPLLGLLGTVTGMIGTFQSITLFGTGDPKLMAGGISTALVTTVLGLVCAIPLLLLHNLIAGKSQQLVQVLEEQSAGLLAEKAEQELKV
jgi:biopolymer transport protein ExbB